MRNSYLGNLRWRFKEIVADYETHQDNLWRAHEVARCALGTAVSVVRFARRLSVRQGPLDSPSRTYQSRRQAGDSRRPWCPDEQTALGADGALFGIGPIGPIRGFSKRAVGQSRRRAI